MKSVLAQKQTGQGFKCNMTIKGPHGSSDGNASIFRGLSHVPAFFRDLQRYLTLKVRSQGITVLFVCRSMHEAIEHVYECE